MVPDFPSLPRPLLIVMRPPSYPLPLFVTTAPPVACSLSPAIKYTSPLFDAAFPP